ncbi:MAG: hypothetical protein ACXABY_26485 [Candidatus Thorarchaeota archaeon]|jgi:hypothetical protein
MKKQIASTTSAVFLGIIVMLMPILAYTQFLGDTEANTRGTASSEQIDSYESTSWKTLEETAQSLGQMDAGTTPFPTSVIQTVLLAGTSLIAALVASLAIKGRIKLAVQDLIPRNQAEKW